MQDAALYASVLIAAVSALMGNRTACVLLVSLAASFFVHTSPGLFLLDLGALALIVRPHMGLADEMIAVLFTFAWAFYGAGEQLRYDAAWTVVVIQNMLCLPVAAIRRETTIAREFLEDLASFLTTRLFTSLRLAR